MSTRTDPSKLKYSAAPVANPFDNSSNLTAQQMRAQILEESKRLKPVSYRCSNCGSEVTIKSRDGLHCNNCNGRVIYKMRTAKKMEFDAK